MSHTTGTPDWWRVTARDDAGYLYTKTCEGWSNLVSYLKATLKAETNLGRVVTIEKVQP